jgi:hypothetical protein
MLRELVLAIGIFLQGLLLAELALDAAHAQDITRAQHPTGRLSAVPAVLIDGQTATSCYWKLRSWLSSIGNGKRIGKPLADHKGTVV